MNRRRAMMRRVKSSASILGLFAANAYTGTGASHDIVNGLDFAGNGGVTFLKRRDADTDIIVASPSLGVDKSLRSNTTAGWQTATTRVTSFNSDGFTLGTNTAVNSNNKPFIAWSFRNAPGFFQALEYTGTGAMRNVSHTLGVELGMIMLKTADTTSPWVVYHRSADSVAPEDYYLELHSNNEAANYGYFNDTPPTSSEFSISAHANVNRASSTYLACLFAHNPAQGIFCGSHAGTGSAGDHVELGFKPQFIMWKGASNTGHWFVYDTARGLGAGADTSIILNDALEEWNSGDLFEPTATGFTIKTGHTDWNGNGRNFVFMAIKEGVA